MTITRWSLSPLIQSAILECPSAGVRAVLAAELLLAGHIQRQPDDANGNDNWTVSGSRSQNYQVSIRRGTCDCPDSQAPMGVHGEKLCKHMRACLFAVEIDPNQEPIIPDRTLDDEITAKLDQLIAAGVTDHAEILAIGDWLWIVGDPDVDTMDELECQWHERRGCHYWRPIWAAVAAFNDYAGLDELAAKYGLRRRIGQPQKSRQELAMLLIPKLNRDEDGELWA